MKDLISIPVCFLFFAAAPLSAEWDLIVGSHLDDHWQKLKLNWAYSAGEGWYYLPEAKVWIYEARSGPGAVRMELVEGATFLMGSSSQREYVSQDEKPQHEVTLTYDYWIQTTETTWSQWNEVRDWALLNGYFDLSQGSPGFQISTENGSMYPVVDITWYDIIKWLNAYSEMTGLNPCYTKDGAIYRDGIHEPDWDENQNGFRLPTEAEWEFACKGSSPTDFYNGDLSQPLCSPLDPVLDLIGWYCGNTDGPREVRQRYPNSLGLFDMSGSIWEWCWNKGPYDYTELAAINPAGPDIGIFRIGRGGAWAETAHECRSTNRSVLRPTSSTLLFGFRPVRTHFPSPK